MNKINHILLFSAILAGLSSCASEAPFWEKGAEGEGKILTSSLTVKVKGDEKLVRADSNVPDVNKFTVDFIDPQDPEEGALKTYTYSKMPEVVTLPVGTYQVKAYYGGSYGDDEEATAAFNAPYYLGLSSNFTIESNKIIDNIQPIECKLANVKVTIYFDDELVKNMSGDSSVEVSVGESNPLTFTKTTEGSGFFKAPEGTSTLIARFSGVVEGDPTEETKIKSDVTAGTHYKITFKLHAIDPNEPGNITSGGDGDDAIKIDASVNLEDLTGDGGENIIPDEEIYLEDDRYPNENPEPGPDDPGNDDPVTDEGPMVTCVGAEFGINNQLEDMTECEINVSSESGITGFTVDIISNSLTPEELEGVSLAKHLDLVEPGELLDALQGLGFLEKPNPETSEGGQTSLRGVKEAKLSITTFLNLLPALGSSTSHFEIRVSDDSGTTERILTLIVGDGGEPLDD